MIEPGAFVIVYIQAQFSRIYRFWNDPHGPLIDALRPMTSTQSDGVLNVTSGAPQPQPRYAAQLPQRARQACFDEAGGASLVGLTSTVSRPSPLRLRVIIILIARSIVHLTEACPKPESLA